MKEKYLSDDVYDEPSVFAVPCDKAFVVDDEKAKEFKSLKPNKELKQKREELIKKLNIKVELKSMDYSGQVLRKIKNKRA